MARAKRHYIPGYIWHITHRCHKREFLLKFSKDRHRYLQWLYQARKRYGLTILNYMVTCNPVHLLVADDGDRDVIPHSMQLVAGRTGTRCRRQRPRHSSQRIKVCRAVVSNTRCIIKADGALSKLGSSCRMGQNRYWGSPGNSRVRRGVSGQTVWINRGSNEEIQPTRYTRG
jgi:REP element-mobilizing transposase RayT